MNIESYPLPDEQKLVQDKEYAAEFVKQEVKKSSDWFLKQIKEKDNAMVQ